MLAAVIDEATRRGVTVNRVSQGSGAMLQSDAELHEMAQLGADAGLEVSLFIGPREEWGTYAMSRAADGGAVAGGVRGLRQLTYAVEDVLRAAECGIRGFLVADLGLLVTLVKAQADGEIPADVVWKVSVMLAPSNPATLAVLAELGADTVNLPTDLSLDELADMRAVCDLPLDLYVEAPDALGGIVRGEQLADLAVTTSPLYAKFGLRNSRPLYPSGGHIEADAIAIAREKVRRAQIALEWVGAPRRRAGDPVAPRRRRIGGTAALMAPLRSSRWFSGDDEVAVIHRVAARNSGVDPGTDGARPVIGIANSASDLNPCNLPLNALAADVARGIREAGGVPMEFPVMSLGEDLMKPTAMLYRNLVAMEVEEYLRAYPLDGVVLLANCDKSVPSAIMGAVSADLPALVVTAGPRPVSSFHGRRVGTGTDLWRAFDAHRSGAMNDADWHEFEGCLVCGQGSCNTMGTASSMAIVTELLGMMLPGAAAIPATDPARAATAHATGMRIVEMVRDQVRPSDVLTDAAFRNAVRGLNAAGGSTNVVLHLLAIAGRAGRAAHAQRYRTPQPGGAGGRRRRAVRRAVDAGVLRRRRRAGAGRRTVRGVRAGRGHRIGPKLGRGERGRDRVGRRHPSSRPGACRRRRVCGGARLTGPRRRAAQDLGRLATALSPPRPRRGVLVLRRDARANRRPRSSRSRATACWCSAAPARWVCRACPSGATCPCRRGSRQPASTTWCG